MIPDSTSSPQTQVIANNLFVFVLLAFIPAVMTEIAFVLSPVSPSPLFAQIRSVIIVVFGALVLVILLTMIWILRTDEQNLHRLSRGLVQVFQRPVLMLSGIILLIEINIMAAHLLVNVAPAIVEPARFLLLTWTLVAAAFVVTANYPALRQWLTRTRMIWSGIGLLLTGLLIVTGLHLLTLRLIQSTNVDDRIRGALDYRQLAFIPDGEAPAPSEFWQEQAQTRVTWLPYTYWKLDAFTGDYIQVSESGIRHTPLYTDDADALKLFFFGGSTMWGEGARDAYTIPGHVARLLYEQGNPQQVVNMGQTGYVSTQDMILFQMQLAQGNVPDVAVFYQGFNDILSAYSQQMTGVTLQETQRIVDVEAGRLLRAGQPVLQPLSISLEQFDLSLAATDSIDPQIILDRWLANRRMIQAIAGAYDVRVLFVWQPAMNYKSPLTAWEQALLDRTEMERPGLFALYREIDILLQAYIQQTKPDDILVLSDLFENDDRLIFHDLVHITEAGNLTVAEALMPALIDFVEQMP